MVNLGMNPKENVGSLFAPEERFALAAVPDEKKGEAVVLLYAGARTAQEIRAALGSLKLPALFVPSYVYSVEAIPLLGSGKVDLKALKTLALRCHKEAQDGKKRNSPERYDDKGENR